MGLALLFVLIYGVYLYWQMSTRISRGELNDINDVLSAFLVATSIILVNMVVGYGVAAYCLKKKKAKEIGM